MFSGFFEIAPAYQGTFDSSTAEPLTAYHWQPWRSNFFYTPPAVYESITLWLYQVYGGDARTRNRYLKFEVTYAGHETNGGVAGDFNEDNTPIPVTIKWEVNIHRHLNIIKSRIQTVNSVEVYREEMDDDGSYSETGAIWFPAVNMVQGAAENDEVTVTADGWEFSSEEYVEWNNYIPPGGTNPGSGSGTFSISVTAVLSELYTESDCLDDASDLFGGFAYGDTLTIDGTPSVLFDFGMTVTAVYALNDDDELVVNYTEGYQFPPDGGGWNRGVAYYCDALGGGGQGMAYVYGTEQDTEAESNTCLVSVEWESPYPPTTFPDDGSYGQLIASFHCEPDLHGVGSTVTFVPDDLAFDQGIAHLEVSCDGTFDWCSAGDCA